MTQMLLTFGGLSKDQSQDLSWYDSQKNTADLILYMYIKATYGIQWKLLVAIVFFKIYIINVCFMCHY